MLTHDRVVENAADAERIGCACDAFVWVLGGDPRVRAAYAAWRVAHGLVGPFADLATFRAAVLRDLEADLRLLERFVQTDLELSYVWLPQMLLADFRLTVLGEVTGDSSLSVRTMPGTLMQSLPPGRRAKAHGRALVRDVEWYYRARVKRPPDSIRRLAAEYSQQAGRVTDARSVVQTAVQRAEILLAAPSLDPPDVT